MRIISALITLIIIIACNNSAKDKKDVKDTAQKNIRMPEQPAIADTVFTGFGTEPFWSVYVIKDSKIIFHPADGPDVEVPYAAATNPDAVTTEYRSSGNDNNIELIIFRQDCSDGMSDETHRYKVTLFVNKTKYMGCGRSE
ncbi:MAG: COG3650 family protein [Bacteroidota bacterium]